MDFSTSHSTSSSHEVAARRRALSNISKIVASLRPSRNGLEASQSGGMTPSSQYRFRGYQRTGSGGYEEGNTTSNFLFPTNERRRFTRAVEPINSYEGLDYYNWNNNNNTSSTSNGGLNDPNRRQRRRIRRNRRNRHGKRFPSFKIEQDIDETFSSGTTLPIPPPRIVTVRGDKIEQPIAQPLGALPIRSLSSSPAKSSNEQSDNITECRETPPPSPRESRLSAQDDPASGASAGGYGTSSSVCSDEEDRTLICGSDCAERIELLSLREQVTSQLRELRHLQEQNYMLLNASLQENFQATGALEGRFDAFLNRGGKNGMRRGAAGGEGTQSMGHASTVLMWTLADTVSAIILWLITVVIAKPYDVVRRSLTVGNDDKGSDHNDGEGEKLRKRTSITRGSNEIDEGAYFFSRKSWRLDNSSEMLFNHDGINSNNSVPFHSNKQIRRE